VWRGDKLTFQTDKIERQISIHFVSTAFHVLRAAAMVGPDRIDRLATLG
jgi:hypothetical protein